MSNCKFIGYLSFGYPDIETSLKRADIYINSGCDILEIDLPTNNPFLDSEFIGNRMKEAYLKCNDYDIYFENINKIRNKYPQLKILLLSYEHSIIEYGVEKFIINCKLNNIEDVILVGNKDDEIKNILKISVYIQYHLDEKEIKNALNSNGFIYLQAKCGEKGFKEGFETLEKIIEYLRSLGISNPIYCGVGISTKDDYKMVNEAGEDAAFIGSALLKKETDQDIEKMIKSWKSYIK